MLASIAPEMLCHTEKIAPGTVAMDRFGNAVPARDVASPEFCIPISIDSAFFCGRDKSNIVPSRNPKTYPSRLRRITMANTTIPVARMLCALCDITAPTINAMAITDMAGRISLILSVYSPQYLLIMKPAAIGMIMTLIMDRNMLMISTDTDVLRASQVMAGVRIGASSVLIVVIPTDNATSPLLRYVITLLEVPPGQIPTSITPASRPVSNENIFPSKNASSGIIVNCAIHPRMMFFGC